jgi:AcrR family transcriptional regulator
MKADQNTLATAATTVAAATEQRLIDAAGAVFAEKGFRAATIREIIHRARANIAAVNYHFGDKEGLYAAVFRFAKQACAEKHSFVADETPGATTASLRDRLHQIVHSLLLRMLDQGRPAWQWKLMAREMMEPTKVLDEMVETTIRPDFEIFAKLVSQITGLPLTDRRVRWCVGSAIGQVMFYRHAQEVVRRLHPEQGFDPKDLEELADHITDFSFCALQAIANQPKRDPAKPSASPLRSLRREGSKT